MGKIRSSSSWPLCIFLIFQNIFWLLWSSWETYLKIIRLLYLQHTHNDVILTYVIYNTKKWFFQWKTTFFWNFFFTKLKIIWIQMTVSLRGTSYLDPKCTKNWFFWKLKKVRFFKPPKRPLKIELGKKKFFCSKYIP